MVRKWVIQSYILRIENIIEYMFQSIPGEFSMDQTAILQRAEANSGFVTASLLARGAIL